MKTIDVTPSPSGYESMLKLIIRQSTRKEDVIWAKEELERIKSAIERGSWL